MWRLRRVSDGLVIRKGEKLLWPLLNGCRKCDGSRYKKREAECMKNGDVVYKMQGITCKMDVSAVRFNGSVNEGHSGPMIVKTYGERPVPFYLEEYEEKEG